MFETQFTVKTASGAIYLRNDIAQSKVKAIPPEKQLNPRNAKNTKNDEPKHKQQKKNNKSQWGSTDSEYEQSQQTKLERLMHTKALKRAYQDSPQETQRQGED